MGSQTRSVYVLLRQGSVSVSIFDSSFVPTVEGFLYVEGAIYQIASVQNSKQVTLSKPFTGGFSDIVLVYYVPMSSQGMLPYNAPAETVRAYLESQFTDIYPSYANTFTVSRQSLALGYSWLVTFVGEMFNDNVNELIVWSSADPQASSSAIVPFSINGVVTTLAKTSVHTLMNAGDVHEGLPVFVRVLAINGEGVGPAQLCATGNGGSPQGSIIPRSPPGLPVNVAVWSVPASDGSVLNVTWSPGRAFGSPVTQYVVEYAVNPTPQSPFVTAATVMVTPQSAQTIYFSTVTGLTPGAFYIIRVRAFNDQGSSGPVWYRKATSQDQLVDFNALTSNVDFNAGAQRASPYCLSYLKECSEKDADQILARGLPSGSEVYVPSFPVVDAAQSLTSSSGFIYFNTTHPNGGAVDKWLVQWGTDASFTSTNTLSAIVLASPSSVPYYNITGLKIGTWYYVQVTAHHTGGYGLPSPSYGFKPYQQPDPPFSPKIAPAYDATDLVTFARSGNVTWSPPRVSGPDLVGDGGDYITGYVIEWSKVPFSRLIPTIQNISIRCDNHTVLHTFRLSLTTQNSHNMPHDGEFYQGSEYFISGTYNSADIPVTSTAYQLQTILQNMPNIAQVTVTKFVTANSITWMVTFSEISEVALLKVVHSNLLCHGSIETPTVTYHQHARFPVSSSYAWMEVPVTPDAHPAYFLIDNLIPGQRYFTRMLARNSLGYGSRRLTAPASMVIPITQPTTATELEGPWASPRLYVASPTSLLVKMGAPVFDGGSITTHFNVQWDTATSFTSGYSDAPVGSAAVPAFTVLCRLCVSTISFKYNTVNPLVTVSYVGSSDILRQLQTGVRIVIPTADDGIPYTFTVADVQPTLTSFIVDGVGLRQTNFVAVDGNYSDLYLMGAQYEISGLLQNTTYYVRVSAENSVGVCSPDMYFIAQCGAFVSTNPAYETPRQAPIQSMPLSSVVVDESSVQLTWTAPISDSAIASYRVDAFQRSPQATTFGSSLSSFSFFGNAAVQVLSTSDSSVTGGTFTVAYDSFSVPLPGTVSGFFNLRYFNTTEDLSSYLEPGDNIWVDGRVYTVAPFEYKTAGYFYVMEQIVTYVLHGDVTAAVAYARPKTLPVSHNILGTKLASMLQNQPLFGQVEVVRTTVGNGYHWTITFASNVGWQPNVVINPLQLLGSHPSVYVTTLTVGVSPLQYASAIIPVGTYSNASSWSRRLQAATSTAAASSTFSYIFNNLTTGAQWFFRVLPTNDKGDGVFSGTVINVPASVPDSPSSVAIFPFNASALLIRFSQDAYNNGDTITSYNVSIQSPKLNISAIVPVSFTTQQVVTAAHTLPFTSTSTFTLSIGSYYGNYYVYAGVNGSIDTRVDALHNRTYLQRSADVNRMHSISNFITPGEFINVGQQEFRVCLNQDHSFIMDNAVLNSSVIPLCDVATAMTAASFDAGFTGHVLQDIPVYVLDTVVGGIQNPALGQSVITVVHADGSLNPNVQQLSYGDWLMVGHPATGEVFRIQGVSSQHITLGSHSDASVTAALSIASLQHATYTVQSVTFSTAAPAFIAADLTTGFRISFRGATTYVTQAGGDYGCLPLSSSAWSVQAELMRLASIDEVVVSKSSTAHSVTYSITFTGSLVR